MCDQKDVSTGSFKMQFSKWAATPNSLKFEEGQTYYFVGMYFYHYSNYNNVQHKLSQSLYLISM
jgi:hypothetical protein